MTGESRDDLRVPDDGPTIDLDAAATLLRKVEARQQSGGWSDGPAMVVYTVYDPHDLVTSDLINRAMCGMGKPVMAGRYAAQPLIKTAFFDRAHREMGLQAFDALRRFAFNTAFADPEAIRVDPDDGDVMADGLTAFRQLAGMTGVLGFIVCHEAYGVPEMTTRAAARLVGSRQHLREQPGSREMRIAMMVDVHDRMHRVSRVRGQAPQLALDVHYRGDITTSLRLLMDMAQNRLPTDQAGYDERYPTLTELVNKGGRLVETPHQIKRE